MVITGSSPLIPKGIIYYLAQNLLSVPSAYSSTKVGAKRDGSFACDGVSFSEPKECRKALDESRRDISNSNHQLYPLSLHHSCAYPSPNLAAFFLNSIARVPEYKLDKLLIATHSCGFNSIHFS